MADNVAVELTRVYVSDDLGLLIWGKESVTLSSLLYGAMEVKTAELPALLARLTAAAEAMGVETDLVKALKEAQAYLVDHMPAHALGVIEQALANVK